MCLKKQNITTGIGRIEMKEKQRFHTLVLIILLIGLAACTADLPPENSADNEPAESSTITEPVASDTESESAEPSDTAESEPEPSDTGESEPEPSGTAELLFTNGAIYTVNPDQPWAEAVAIDSDGVIVAVGNTADILLHAAPNAEIIDLAGKMMLPGFQDVHLHALEAGINANNCDLSELGLEDYPYVLQECADQQSSDQRWIRAAGVNMAELLELHPTPIEILDEAFPDRPVIVLDDLGHGAWLNTIAMQEVGYLTAEIDPPGGILVVDPDSDEWTGVILENAQQIVRTASTPRNEANLEAGYQSLLQALDILAENGITTVSDAGGYWPRGHHEIWQRAADEETLSVRASNALYVYPDMPQAEQIAELQKIYSDDPDSLLRFDQVKIYIDGILSQGTGALLTPYDTIYGLPGVPDKGFFYFETEILNSYVQELEALGFQLHFHTTGDHAARLALDTIAQSAAVNQQPNQRHRITHLYLIDPQDRDRFAELEVVADFQLSPSAISDDYYQGMSELIGGRADDMFPMGDLIDRGATVTLSSDWDADPLSPLAKLESLILADDGSDWDLETLIPLMTINPAFLLHHDDVTGSIEVGKFADVVILEQNIFDLSPNQIGETAVLLTLLQGEEVYRHTDMR